MLKEVPVTPCILPFERILICVGEHRSGGEAGVGTLRRGSESNVDQLCTTKEDAAVGKREERGIGGVAVPRPLIYS